MSALNLSLKGAAFFSAIVFHVTSALAAPAGVEAPESLVERGRYLVKMTGCNDCHTAGYAPANGEIPEDKWLMGDPIGWYGPWGTTYAINLRSFTAKLSEEQWIATVSTAKARPPMPWYVLTNMKKDDLKAIYAFIKHLGAGGEEMPMALAPNEQPKPPYVNFNPVLPK